ncbi:MAG: hypothetical protein K2Q45_06730 [Nitrosomonas sp.]|nr:hypothetical protein [Nitrosomonas sp.]
MSDDEGFFQPEDDDMLFDDEEDENLIAFQKSKFAAADSVAFENDDEDENNNVQAAAPVAQGPHLVPYSVVPVQETNAVQQEYAVVDNVSYYNQLMLLCLMYGRQTRGIKSGALYDEENQKLQEKKLVRFDF